MYGPKHMTGKHFSVGGWSTGGTAISCGVHATIKGAREALDERVNRPGVASLGIYEYDGDEFIGDVHWWDATNGHIEAAFTR